jgi:hypothetical protein
MKFYPLDKKKVFGLEFILGNIRGNAPYQKYFKLGENLRAYETPRYIDKGIVTLRGEYRIKPWDSGLLSRIGFVTFIETGKVFDKINNFNLNHCRYSLGCGVRYTISEIDKLNIRFDFAVGQNSQGVMFLLREAF